VTTPPLPRTSLEPVCLALAAVIRQRREWAGLSLNQLAKRAGLSQQRLSFVESGRRIPTLDTAEVPAVRSL
jgi:transcriptional regulator with XRE-family HTH domain